MELEIVFRAMEPSAALEKYVAKYFEKFKKYLGKEDPSAVFLHVILEGHFNHHINMVEVRIKSNHFDVMVKKEGAEMYSLIDETMHVVEKELQKSKEKFVDQVKHRKKCC